MYVCMYLCMYVCTCFKSYFGAISFFSIYDTVGSPDASNMVYIQYNVPHLVKWNTQAYQM